MFSKFESKHNTCSIKNFDLKNGGALTFVFFPKYMFELANLFQFNTFFSLFPKQG